MSQLMSIVAYCSSALNPFIYSYMSESFRASLKSEFSGCCCWFEETTHHEQATHQINHDGSLVSRSKSLRSTIRGSFRSFRSEKNFQGEHHIQQSKMLTSYFIQNKQKLIKSSAINNFQSANSNIQLADFNRVDSLYSDPDTQQDVLPFFVDFKLRILYLFLGHFYFLRALLRRVKGRESNHFKTRNGIVSYLIDTTSRKKVKIQHMPLVHLKLQLMIPKLLLTLLKTLPVCCLLRHLFQL